MVDRKVEQTYSVQVQVEVGCSSLVPSLTALGCTDRLQAFASAGSAVVAVLAGAYSSSPCCFWGRGSLVEDQWADTMPFDTGMDWGLAAVAGVVVEGVAS